MILLQLVYRVVAADDVITSSEKSIIDQIVAKLTVSPQDHERIKALFEKDFDTTDHYYKVLGVSKNATKEEIKKTYKEACKKYHPDKVHHLGDEFRKVAEEKMQEINVAYTHISKQHAVWFLHFVGKNGE